MASQYTIYQSPSYANSSSEHSFTQGQINEAIKQALFLLQTGQQLGDEKFPQAFKKHYHGLHVDQAEAPFFEFPVLHSGVYDGKVNAGADRVVFGSVAKDYQSAQYVGIFAAVKDGLKAHAFPDTTVNNQGQDAQFKVKGHPADTPLPRHEELAPPAGRELLQHDDVLVELQD